MPRRLLARRGLLIALAVILVIVGVFVIRPFWRLSSQFDDLTFRQPSRLYGLSPVLAEGKSYPRERLIEDLRAEGYREDEGSASLPPGRYQEGKTGLAVHLRSFPLPDGKEGGGLVEVGWQGSRVSRLRLAGTRAGSVALEPPLLASYYGASNQERRPVELDEVSQDLINAVIAAEDDRFYQHSGVSISGVLRAMWVNLRGGSIRQGGSTLTQQLVKNLYLSHERTVGRKAQELVLALLLEARYGKQQILAAYLNEIYLGGSGGVSLMGMGAASHAYFGKDPGQLNLAEAATLAGMIRAPAAYSPLTHPDKAKERRDWVLERMRKLGLAEGARVDQALEQPVSTAPEPMVRRWAPYFADAMAFEAQKRWGIEELADSGYVLFSTLDWRSQQTAIDVVREGLERSEKGYQKGHKGKGPLQAALVSIDPRTGGILAYVGGRSYEESQFDRAGQALRQPGSSFKPVVYAAAFETGKVTPSTPLEDTPLTIRKAGLVWSPRNDDGSYHGWVTVRRALEHSYNPATARLGQEVGMEKVVALAHDMGITAKIDPFPSVALGAFETTPVELAGVYATLANQGVRAPVHGLLAILDPHRKPLAGLALPEPERVLTPQTVYLVTSLLQGVLLRGTAAGAAAGIPGDVAGKTGTTNKRRDSWFGGYARERATVVWVGYDDNSITHLSGARAALPIWVRFMAKAAPKNGYSAFRQPPGLTSAVIDPTTGLLATEYCPVVITEVFREGTVPTELCNQHQSYWEQEIADAMDASDGDGAVDDEAGEVAVTVDRGEHKPHPFRSWLRKVFGDRNDNRNKEEEERREEDRPPRP
ncbi:MAG TPA: PBP1A family penicillin-binding protein [Thermoanaerobaculia bacterium]|nr:PBP1A family penicillin-binding protein [Thermoanaerobaculia bacterium]